MPDEGTFHATPGTPIVLDYVGITCSGRYRTLYDVATGRKEFYAQVNNHDERHEEQV